MSGDKTFIRPTPGGSRRAGAPAAPGNGGARPPSSSPMPPIAPPSRAPLPAGGSAPSALGDFEVSGRNRILAAAGPLLALGARLQNSVFQADVAALRRQAVAAVERFNEQAQRAGVSPDDTTIARYILCTFVDAAVFGTPWGSQSDWASQCLLLTFHQELEGGEKFFQIASQMEQNAERYFDTLELQYVCLLLGFKGRYRQGGGGLEDVRERLGALVRRQRGAGATAALSAHWQGVQDRRNRVTRLVPWWIVGIAGLVVLLGIWLLLRSLLAHQGAPLRARLAQQGVSTLAVAEPVLAAPAPRLRLKALLATQENAGMLTVEERGARTVITLGGGTLFPSGGSNLNASSVATVQQIGKALQQVPGAIMVVGHTDDQPVRSFRYQDNFELSRARAIAVASLLRNELGDPQRVEWSGVADTQPLYRPPSRPENRRVEIVHTAAGAVAGAKP